MNILITTPWYPSKGNPINGTFVREQAEALKNAGNTVIVLVIKSFSKKDLFKHRKLIQYKENGITSYYFTAPTIKSGIFNHNTAIIKKDYEKIIKQIEQEFGIIDIIHSHVFFPAGGVSTYIKKDLNIPLIHTEHYSRIKDADFGRDNKQNMLKILNSVSEQSDIFIAVSQSLKKQIEKWLEKPRQIEIVSNVLSDLFYYQQNKEKKSKYRFISIGNLLPNKNHIMQLEAINCSELSNTELIIIGEGTERPKLEKYINNNNLNNRVKLLGRISRERTAEELRNSDCLLLTSHSETFGVVLIEALASGVPAIATYSGGADDIISQNYGITGIKVNDLHALRKEMQNIQNKTWDHERISANALQKFGSKAFVKKIESIYTIAKEKEKSL